MARQRANPAQGADSAPPGAEGRPAAPELRPLNLPLPVAVEVGPDGEPAWLLWRGRRLPVLAVLDRWRVDDEWWRAPVSRLYRRLHLAGDRLLTVFEDLERGGWYAQRYRYPAATVQRAVTRRRRRHLHG